MACTKDLYEVKVRLGDMSWKTVYKFSDPSAYQSSVPFYRNIRCINDQFVGLFESGVIITSEGDPTVGANWKETIAPGYELWDVAYGQNKYVIVGDAGLILQTAP